MPADSHPGARRALAFALLLGCSGTPEPDVSTCPTTEQDFYDLAGDRFCLWHLECDDQFTTEKYEECLENFGFTQLWLDCFDGCEAAACMEDWSATGPDCGGDASAFGPCLEPWYRWQCREVP